jgi:hypothetical protein
MTTQEVFEQDGYAIFGWHGAKEKYSIGDSLEIQVHPNSTDECRVVITGTTDHADFNRQRALLGLKETPWCCDDMIYYKVVAE